MSNKLLGEKGSKMVKRMLDMVLHIEANTSSCIFIYQPKAPKELERFKKEKSRK
mgnify:FL=1